MVEVNNLKKSFDGKAVLQEVDFSVEEGQMVSIVGASGSGKTTLLHLLGTLEKPDEGEVLINQVNPFGFSERQLSMFRNEHIGFIFQSHLLLDEFTAFENICLPAWFSKQKEKEYTQRANELIAFLGIEDCKSRKPAQLSGGEQQRVAIARALINQPKLILADEPTGNLDEGNTENISSLFIRINKEFENTFIIVTHNLHLAEIADVHYQIENGQLIKIR